MQGRVAVVVGEVEARHGEGGLSAVFPLLHLWTVCVVSGFLFPGKATVMRACRKAVEAIGRVVAVDGLDVREVVGVEGSGRELDDESEKLPYTANQCSQ